MRSRGAWRAYWVLALLFELAACGAERAAETMSLGMVVDSSAPGALAAWRPFVFEAVEAALAEIERQYPEYGALAVQQVGPSPERAVVQLCAVCHRDSTPPPR
jgi:hypothetical protein